MRTLANSEDPDEMPHDVAFHQDLHCLLKQKQSSEKKYNTRDYNLGFLNIFNGPCQVYCIKQEISLLSTG